MGRKENERELGYAARVRREDRHRKGDFGKFQRRDSN